MATDSMAKKKQLEEARKEYEATTERLAELERELAEIPQALRNLPWEEGEKVALDTASDLEKRRLALPHLIRRVRKQAALREVTVHELDLEELEAQRPALEEHLAKATSALGEAREVYRKAKGEHDDVVYNQMSDVRNAIRSAKQKLNAIENETSSETAPVVRSVWQQPRDNDEDDIGGDAPGSMHFGNPLTAPLSSGYANKETAVIPEKALREAGR